MQLQLFRKKKTNVKDRLGVCIPQHVKSKTENKIHDFAVQNPVSKSNIVIISNYNIGDTFMVQVNVINGKVEPGMTIDGTDIFVSEIKKSSVSVEALSRGEKGSLFFSKETARLNVGNTVQLVMPMPE